MNKMNVSEWYWFNPVPLGVLTPWIVSTDCQDHRIPFLKSVYWMIIYIPYNSPIGCILLVFFRSFIGLTLTLNFMIHFGLIFIWVMWGQGLGLFIYFLHVSIQLSQHHLLERLSSLPLNALIPLLEINWPSTWGFISFLFCFIDLYHTVLMTVAL